MVEGKPITVLFVDDSDANRYAGARLLRLAGFEVLEAATGVQALEALVQKPDIAVIDVHLPDVDGITLCRMIKSHEAYNSLPVLLMSATFTSTEDRVQGLEEGADGYLAQPFELPVLRATLTSILRVREAEEKAHKLSQQWQITFDAISDGIWILDNRGRIVRGNTAMAQLWKSSGRTLAGRLAMEVVDSSGVLREEQPEIPNSPREVLAALMGEEIKPGKSEVVIGGRWFSVVSHAVAGQDEVPGVVQVWSDITTRKVAEQERLALLDREKVARMEAEEANRLKDEFLATLSHELRTPLMAIIGWVGLLRDDDVPLEQSRTGLEVIERNAKTQSQIINDLLDVSRVIAGKMQLRMEPVDLREVIENALNSIRPSAELKSIRVIHPSGEGACRIQGDAARIQQVLWNLLANAVKFTPRGGVIEVSCTSTQDSVSVEVKDSGQGIESEFLPHVFDRFRQADSSSTRKHGGLGLGLAIVRHITEMHGGHVEVKSEGTGHGTSFILHFPVSTVTAFPEPVNRLQNQKGKVLRGLRIQVVDDQEETRALVAAILAHRGAEVQCSASAQEAMELLQRWHPSLLVSDLGMPGEDGYSLINRVRTLPATCGGSTPALALSAYADTLHRQRALESGFHAFAAKPIEPEELVNVILTLASEAGLPPRG